MRACITPGIHPMSVNRMLSKKAPPKPLFIRTATGGSKMLSIIVNSDIFIVF